MVGNTLTLSSTNTRYDQAYFIEYLTSINSSTNVIGNGGAVINPGALSGSISYPAAADFLSVSFNIGKQRNSARDEEKSVASIYVDLLSQTASGVIFAQSGRGTTRNIAYSFSDYDLNSGQSVLASSATVVGDTTSVADTLLDPVLSLSGGAIDVSYSSAFANGTTSLLQAISYEFSVDYYTWQCRCIRAFNT